MKLFNIYAKTATINTITKTLADTCIVTFIAAAGFFGFFYLDFQGEMFKELLIANIGFLTLLIPIFFIVFVTERLKKISTAKRILPKKKSDVRSIELLDSVVNFNFADKNMNITYPYEMFKSILLELYCHEYIRYTRYGAHKALLIILTLTFNFPDGKTISITPLPRVGSETFTGNFEMDFSIYKIIDFLIKSGNFTYIIKTPYGILPNNQPQDTKEDTDIDENELIEEIKHLTSENQQATLKAFEQYKKYRESLPLNRRRKPYADWPKKIEIHIEKKLMTKH